MKNSKDCFNNWKTLLLPCFFFAGNGKLDKIEKFTKKRKTKDKDIWQTVMTLFLPPISVVCFHTRKISTAGE